MYLLSVFTIYSVEPVLPVILKFDIPIARYSFKSSGLINLSFNQFDGLSFLEPVHNFIGYSLNEFASSNVLFVAWHI